MQRPLRAMPLPRSSMPRRGWTLLAKNYQILRICLFAIGLRKIQRMAGGPPGRLLHRYWISRAGKGGHRRHGAFESEHGRHRSQRNGSDATNVVCTDAAECPSPTEAYHTQEESGHDVSARRRSIHTAIELILAIKSGAYVSVEQPGSSILFNLHLYKTLVLLGCVIVKFDFCSVGSPLRKPSKWLTPTNLGLNL